MIRISDWYTSLGEHSFPTMFLHLAEDEIEAMLRKDEDSAASRNVMGRIQKAIRALFGTSFVSADVCAPTDSPHFKPGRWVSFGRTAWRILATSDKVCTALRDGRTDCITVRPFRRMDHTREFRMFFHDRKLVAMSQLVLDRHHAHLQKREQDIWQKSCKLAEIISPRLTVDNTVVDAYLCSDGSFLLVDFNAWGEPTNPLLLRTWDRDWAEVAGLKLLQKPVKMGGDISVSF